MLLNAIFTIYAFIILDLGLVLMYLSTFFRNKEVNLYNWNWKYVYHLSIQNNLRT